jgi:hypothetical protein
MQKVEGSSPFIRFQAHWLTASGAVIGAGG